MSHGSAQSSCVTQAGDFIIRSLYFLVYAVVIMTFLGHTGPGGRRAHSRLLANENYYSLSLHVLCSPNKTAPGPEIGSFIHGLPSTWPRAWYLLSRCSVKCLLKSEGREGEREQGKKGLLLVLPIFYWKILKILGCCLRSSSAKYRKLAAQE